MEERKHGGAGLGDARHEDRLRNADEFQLLRPSDATESPYVEKRVGTGRARCRICGEKIAKGDVATKFGATLSGEGQYNAWNQVTVQVHEKCLTDAGYTINYRSEFITFNTSE